MEPSINEQHFFRRKKPQNGGRSKQCVRYSEVVVSSSLTVVLISEMFKLIGGTGIFCILAIVE